MAILVNSEKDDKNLLPIFETIELNVIRKVLHESIQTQHTDLFVRLFPFFFNAISKTKNLDSFLSFLTGDFNEQEFSCDENSIWHLIFEMDCFPALEIILETTKKAKIEISSTQLEKFLTKLLRKEDSQTPLDLMLLNCSVGCLSLSLEIGLFLKDESILKRIKETKKQEDNTTLLQCAVRSGTLEMVRTLVSKLKLDINYSNYIPTPKQEKKEEENEFEDENPEEQEEEVIDEQRYSETGTALHFAAQFDKESIAKFLIDHGAEINK